MAETWIDKSFLSVFVHKDVNGKEVLRWVIFGKEFCSADLPENQMGECGFMLSIYQLLIARRLPENPTFVQEIKRTKTIPLLQKLLGNIVSREIEWPEQAYDTNLGGVNYHIRTFLRYSAFENVERWFSIKDSRKKVYLITSDTEQGLPEYSFAPKAWDKRTPTPWEVLVSARELAKLANFDDLFDKRGNNDEPTSDRQTE